jgi:hypothetical protein
MAWRLEAVEAEMDYRLESARKDRMRRRPHWASDPQPSWWRRLRAHRDSAYNSRVATR